jgi:4-hydroxy-3-polyprenylbenzoate decarboxylase
MVNLVVAVTGATGAHAARLLVHKSPWPVSLLASHWGKDVYTREVGPFEDLVAAAESFYPNDQLSAPPASGSVPTAGMVILPCTTDMLAKVANGIADTLITRAAHCHLKERRPLVLCVRETPWSLVDVHNAAAAADAGATIMPLSPPFYMFGDRPPAAISMDDLLDVFADRILSCLGHPAPTTWEDMA